MKKKKLPETIKQSNFPITELPDGQLTFIPEMPYEVQKARGPVIDGILGQELMEQTTFIVDDTVETTSTPLPIQTRVMLDYEGIEIDTGGLVRLTAFDREVIDAVASLVPYNDIITAEMIYRVMMGKRTARYISDNQREMVRKSLMKCSHAWLHISLTDVHEKDSPIGKILKKQGIKAQYSEQILSFRVLQVEANGRKSERYAITSNPVLVSYAKSIGKVSVFPIDLLDTTVSKTAKNIVIQSFLLREIEEMKNDMDVPTLIEVNEIYGIADASNDTRAHKARIRTTVETILGDWIKKNHIKGFTIRKSGSAIKGYDISLDRKLSRN